MPTISLEEVLDLVRVAPRAAHNRSDGGGDSPRDADGAVVVDLLSAASPVSLEYLKIDAQVRVGSAHDRARTSESSAPPPSP